MLNAPDIYFLPEWGQLFQKHDGGKVEIFEFKHEFGHVYYQFIKKPIKDSVESINYFDIITPYGFSGPIVLECDPFKREELIELYEKEFQKYCLDEKIVAEYVRFSPWLKNYLDFHNIYTLKYNNYTLFVDLTGNDFFMEEIAPRTRTKIRKAKKSGIEIEFDFQGKSIFEFERLYQMMAEKNKISEYYLFRREFLYESFSTLKEKQFIINGKFQGEYISSAIFLQYGDYMHYHLAANDPKYYSLNANSLILNEACNWGVTHGKKQLHLGGAFSGQLFQFKRQFTKNGICDYYVGKKIRNQRIYDELVCMKLKNSSIIDTTFFPLYRG